MSKARIKVASITNRLPPKALSGGDRGEISDNTDDASNIDMSKNTETTNHCNKNGGDKRPVGRPRKDPNAKAIPVTVTLWPEEYRELEELRQEISRGLPVALPRSDLARLGIALLAEMKPEDVLAELVKRRRQ